MPWWRRPGVILTALAILVLFALLFSTSDERQGQSLRIQNYGPSTLSVDSPTPLHLTISRTGAGALTRGSLDVQAHTNPGESGSFSSSATWKTIATGPIRQGSATLEIPPAEDWLDIDGRDEAPQLRFRINSGFWNPASYHHSRFEIDKLSRHSALALTLDRPLYQPGQTMLMRTLAIDRNSGVPLVDEELRWQIYDPQTNLIFDHRDTTSEAGVSTAEFKLSERGLQGDYLVRVSHEDRIIEETVSVNPYRLPTFTVDLSTDRREVQPGAEFHWQVQAQYIHGEAVDAEVSVAFEWDEYATPQSLTETQTLNAEGHADGIWQAPMDLKPGSAVKLTATVATEAGRMEEATAVVNTRTVGPQIDILPLYQPHFVEGISNKALAIVTDADGQPMVRQDLHIELDESVEILSTDDLGRAKFEWTPSRSGTVDVTAWLDEVAMSTQSTTFDISPNSRRGIITAVDAIAQVDSALTIELGAHDYPVFLTLEKSGQTLLAESLPPSSKAYEVTVTPGSRARGLSHLRLYGHRLDSARSGHSGEAELDGRPIWIRQAQTAEVELSTDAQEYEPRQRAALDLFFPAGDGHDVYFGLIGVDEALYALAERADIPLQVMLHEDPAVLQHHLAVLDGFDDGDELDRAIASTRFFKALSQYKPAEDGADNRPGGQRTLAPASYWNRNQISLATALLVWLALLIFLAFIYQCWRTSIAGLRRATICYDDVVTSLMILGALTIVGMSLIGLTESFGAPEVIGSLLLLSPLFVVLLGLFLLIHRVENPQIRSYNSSPLKELPALSWYGSYVTMLITGCGLIWFLAENPRIEDFIPEPVIIFALLVLPLLTLLLTLLIWGLIFLAIRRWGLAMLTIGLVSVPLSIFFILLLGPVDQYFSEANQEVSAVSVDGMSAPTGSASSSPQIGLRRGSRNQPESVPVAVEVAEEADDFFQASPAADDEPRNRSNQENDASIRSFFPETMVWMPEIRGDEQGRATASFTIPDSMTTWRLSAFAHTSDGRFGQGETQIQVTRDVFVEMNLPTDLIDGDRLDLPVTVVNHSSDARELTVEVDATGALSTEPLASPTLTVDGSSRQVVTIPVIARGVGYGTLTVEAIDDRSATRIDGERRHTTVAPHGRAITETYSGQVGEGVRHGLSIPSEAIAGTEALDLKLLSGLNAELQEGLEGMLRKPHGCFEQTSSINYPNLQMLALLENTGPDQWPGGAEVWEEAHNNARDYLHLGYQRLLTFESARGGFGLYPSRPAEIMLTAFGLLQLGQMADHQTVDKEMLRRNARWLIARQNTNGTWTADRHRIYGQSSEIIDVQTTALVVMGLIAAGGEPDDSTISRATRTLYTMASQLEASYPRVMAANALIAADQSSRARQLINDLPTSPLGDGIYVNAEGPTWMGGRGDQAGIEATAMTVVAAHQLGMQQNLPEMLDSLLANRSSWGGWGSTQSTVWALKALQQMSNRGDARAELLARYDGQPLMQVEAGSQEGRHQGVIRIAPGPGRVYSLLAENISPGSGVLAIDTTADTGTRYQANVEYALPWTSDEAQAQDNLLLSLELDSRDRTVHNITEISARAQNTSRRRYDTLIIELPIAPGAFVPRQQLEDAVDNNQIDYFEVLPTHIRLYVESIDAGQTFEFTYEFIPLLRGQVTLPPMRAFEFYTPLPRHEIDGQALTVR